MYKAQSLWLDQWIEARLVISRQELVDKHKNMLWQVSHQSCFQRTKPLLQISVLDLQPPPLPLNLRFSNDSKREYIVWTFSAITQCRQFYCLNNLSRIQKNTRDLNYFFQIHSTLPLINRHILKLKGAMFHLFHWKCIYNNTKNHLQSSCPLPPSPTPLCPLIQVVYSLYMVFLVRFP